LLELQLPEIRDKKTTGKNLVELQLPEILNKVEGWGEATAEAYVASEEYVHARGEGLYYIDVYYY
jgi:hypothetical protein